MKLFEYGIDGHPTTMFSMGLESNMSKTEDLYSWTDPDCDLEILVWRTPDLAKLVENVESLQQDLVMRHKAVSMMNADQLHRYLQGRDKTAKEEGIASLRNSICNILGI